MAVLAAVIFSWTSIFFTISSQRLGVTTVNLVRLPAGAACLALSHLVITGRLWPADLAMADQFWGDYFGSFVDKFSVHWMINTGSKS